MSFNNVLPGWFVAMWLIDDELTTKLGYDQDQINTFWHTPNPHLNDCKPVDMMPTNASKVIKHVETLVQIHQSALSSTRIENPRFKPKK